MTLFDRGLHMQTLDARYRLEDEIGAGGEAHVFRAHDLVTGADVAVRISPAGGMPEPAAEIPALHPGWVRLLDHGIDPAHGAYAVFDLLRGETLAALSARGPLTHEAWLGFTRQSLDAVAALHRSGWVHGDLNSENFLLDAGVTWKLLELPFHSPSPLRERSPLFGSIHTLAPEQLGGSPPNAQSDLYALGCLYYKAATNVYPHAVGSEAEIAVERLRFSARPVRELACDFPEAWAGWIMHLLAREAAERPADAHAARQLLEMAANPA